MFRQMSSNNVVNGIQYREQHWVLEVKMAQ